MGIFRQVIITDSDPSERIVSLTNYLNSFEGANPISAVTDTVEIDGTMFLGTKFEIQGTSIEGFIGYSGNDTTSTAIYLYNGEVPLIETETAEDETPANLSADIYIDEKCICIAINDLNADHAGLEVMLVNTVDSRTLVGYKSLINSNDRFVDISTLVFEDTNDIARIEYSYTNMFPYTAPTPILDFLSQAYFVNGGIKAFTVDILRECSEVPLLSTASLPSPLNNHLAIGTHCLVPIDDSTGGET